MKRIIICADGTWNKPEEDLSKDFPTNVLKFARALAPIDNSGVEQVVFYDWGLGSYHDSATAGAFGSGINKNIADGYRFIVQNYNPGDELYFFGFSRGAYTVRSLSGLIYNCGILKRKYANRTHEAYDIYKNTDIHPRDQYSVNYRKKYSVNYDVRIKFIGVWDTVGALGIPIRMLGFLNEKHLFHDKKIGPNIDVARHALSIDEKRDDFEATIWKQRKNMDLKQVWFAGVHADVGGGYKPNKKGELLSDIPLQWMINEASKTGLNFEDHLLKNIKGNFKAEQHEEYQGFFKLMGKRIRKIYKHTYIHNSVRERYNSLSDYNPEPIKDFVKKYGWINLTD